MSNEYLMLACPRCKSKDIECDLAFEKYHCNKCSHEFDGSKEAIE